MITGTDYQNFRKTWSKYDPKGTCYIETTDLLPLIAQLEYPVGYKDKPHLK